MERWYGNIPSEKKSNISPAYPLAYAIDPEFVRSIAMATLISWDGFTLLNQYKEVDYPWWSYGTGWMRARGHTYNHPLKRVRWVVLRSVDCLAGHHISCLSSIGQIDVKMFVVRAGWYPQLTNEHCEVLFIHNCSCFVSKETKSSIFGPYAKDINTYVYI